MAASTVDMKSGVLDLNFSNLDIRYSTMTRTVDFATLKSGTTFLAAGESADVLTIPAGFVVEEVLYKIVTASTTASSVFGLGTAADQSYFMANTMDATATAGTTVKTVAVATASKFKGSSATPTTLMALSTLVVTSADSLSVLAGATAPTNGKVKLFVRGFFLP